MKGSDVLISYYSYYMFVQHGTVLELIPKSMALADQTGLE